MVRIDKLIFIFLFFLCIFYSIKSMLLFSEWKVTSFSNFCRAKECTQRRYVTYVVNLSPSPQPNPTQPLNDIDDIYSMCATSFNVPVFGSLDSIYFSLYASR